MSAKGQPSRRFAGYSRPNYTPVPDQLFDEQLPDLSGAELKVLLYLMRRIFGFKKESDNVSLNQLLHGITTRAGVQLDRGTGLSRSTLIDALKGLVEKGHIIAEQRSSRERGNEATNYRLNVIPFTPGTETERGTSGNRTGLVGKEDPQETVRQETDGHHRDSLAYASEERNPAAEVGEPAPVSQRGRRGMIAVAAVVDRERKRLQATSVAAHASQLQAAIREITEEFHDTDHLRSNLRHAHRLLQESRASETAFLVRLYEARAITRQQALHPGRGSSPRKKIPYMFAVLRDLLGLREEKAMDQQGA